MKQEPASIGGSVNLTSLPLKKPLIFTSLPLKKSLTIPLYHFIIKLSWNWLSRSRSIKNRFRAILENV